MKHKTIKLVAAFLLSSGLIGLQAQEVIPVTGGTASGNGGSVSYSIGQVTYQTHIGTNGSVAEGAQQPYEISVVTGVEQTDIHLAVSAYPNPTTDNLTLLFSEDVQTTWNLANLSYQLCDMQGKILQSEMITDFQTSIVTHHLKPAIYFVNILEGKEGIKTFKIVKN